MMGYEQAPAGIVFLKAEQDREAPKDLEGKSLGAAANDGGFKLFPTFMQHTGIDASKVEHQIHRPEAARDLACQTRSRRDYRADLQYQAGAQGEGYQIPIRSAHSSIATMVSTFTATASRLRPASCKEHPDAVKGFIRATIKGVQDMVKDPEMAVQMTLKYEPLLNADIERDRLKSPWSAASSRRTCSRAALAMSTRPASQRGIKIVAEGYKLPQRSCPRRRFQFVLPAAAKGQDGQVSRPVVDGKGEP